MLRLYTFHISHFSEKARWALDWEGVAYEEKVLVPGPHQLVTRRIARKTSVPVLEHDGRYVQGSSAIIDYVADRLGGQRLTPADPEARARNAELEQQVDHAFGLGVQRVLYSALLKYRADVTDLWAGRGPTWARGFYAVAYPVVAAVVKRMYKTTDAAAVQSAKQRFVTMFDTLDEMLVKGPYLGGDQPNRLDITVASLLAPVCAPVEHLVKWPSVPVELAEFHAQLKGRPTYEHTLRMYREFRKR